MDLAVKSLMHISLVKKLFLIALAFTITFTAIAQNLHPAVTQPIDLDQIKGYKDYPIKIKQLIQQAQHLTQKNLTYLYGSAHPKNGGMDCSGTIYFLLNSVHLNTVPRDSNGIYQWAKQKGNFHTVNSNQFNSTEFSNLQPGDLLFWRGTYDTPNQYSISHVMIYLGKSQQNTPIMFGSSNGRTYQGKKMWGVSLFDFILPKPGVQAKFVGYSCIPDLSCQ